MCTETAALIIVCGSVWVGAPRWEPPGPGACPERSMPRSAEARTPRVPFPGLSRSGAPAGG